MDGNNGVIVDNTVLTTGQRDNKGRFIHGNNTGIAYEKGASGRPKGAKGKKVRLVKQIAHDVLMLDPFSGKAMSYKEYIKFLKWWCLDSAKIGEWFLNQAHGKPMETVVQEQRLIIMPPLPPTEDTVVHTVEGKDTTIDMVSEGGVEAVSPHHNDRVVEESK